MQRKYCWNSARILMQDRRTALTAAALLVCTLSILVKRGTTEIWFEGKTQILFQGRTTVSGSGCTARALRERNKYVSCSPLEAANMHIRIPTEFN